MATSAEKQFAAFIDRILRLKEEQDEIGAQVRDVYLEMKGVGYDKTAAGALVTELRKRDKSGAKFEEANAMLELYRLSYENAKSSHTHAHARETAIISPASARKAAGSAPRYEGGADANTGGEDVDSSASARPSGQGFVGAEPHSVESGVDVEFVERTTSGPDAKRAPHFNQQPPSSQVVDEPEAVVPPSPASGSPIQFVRKTAKDYRPNCLNPECCAASGLDHCHACKKAMAASEVAA